MYSYTGRILHIDLSTKETSVQTVSEEFLKKYLGGVGLASKLLYDNIKPGVDPLSPENVLTFASSAFGGTIVPVGTKHGIASKSPLTGFLGDSLSSSYWSQTIKRAGYDGIVIKGKSEDLIYLFIDDDDVHFKNAEHLAGLGCFETEEAIRDEIGDQNVRVCTIGLAGENLVKFACISNDRGRKAGRTGQGAVMGSKNLKAIALRGSKPINVANPEELSKKCFDLMKIAQGTPTEKYRILGTPANVLVMNRLATLPTRNFQSATFEKAELVSGEYLHEHYVEKTVACSGCPIACEHIAKVEDGPYKDARTKVEYESLFALGPCCGIDYMPAIIKACELCDTYGMDTMSTGVTVAWAMECYEKGIFTKKDTDGLDIKFGNHEPYIKLIEKIAKREGIGDLLAEGTKRASEKVGKGSKHFAMNVKGLECPGYDPRGLKTFALGCAVGTRGPCHNRSGAYEADIKGWTDRFTYDKEKGKYAAERENYAATFDSFVLCKFIRGCFEDYYKEASDLYTLTTGIEMTPDELKKTGERIWNLKKAFNIREGWTRKDDTLPPRIMKDPIPEGVAKGHLIKKKDLEFLKDAYYKARGWTKDGMIPKEKLVELGLDDIAKEVGV
ncbi:putative oxidoreductase YdhV [subsurface metagenome]